MKPFVAAWMHAPNEPLLVLAFMPAVDEVVADAFAVGVKANGAMGVWPACGLEVVGPCPDCAAAAT